MDDLCVRVTRRPPDDKRTQHQAVMVCARAMGLTFAEAGVLLQAAPLVLPGALPAAEAEALATALTGAGTPSSAVPAPAAGPKCPQHPRFLAQCACKRCMAPLCALCRARGEGLCPACARRARFFRRFARVRLGILLLIFVLIAIYGLLQRERRQARKQWHRTVPVDVILLAHGPIPPATLDSLRDSVPRLEDSLGGEFQRYRAEALLPFSFHVHGPVDIVKTPPVPPDGEDLWPRVEHQIHLWRYLSDVRDRGHLTLGSQSVHLYVVLDPIRTRLRFVEGFGADGGDIGVVHAVTDDRTVDQVLVAMGHELMHCLGATDKYDDAGHAVAPGGLAEPELAPTYPQTFAEIMVGEIPQAPGKGKPIDSLDEVRIGPMTAAEIGWAR